MKNTQNATIVLLTATAAILLGLLIGSWTTQPAQAGYASVSKGDYIMVPYQWSDRIDLICVFDVATRKMNIYVPNLTNKSLDLQQQVDVERVFSSSD